MSRSHLTWVEIDLGAVAHNCQQLQTLIDMVPPSTGADAPPPPPLRHTRSARTPTLMAMVKSNAYGHGLLEVSRTVVACGAGMLGVATLEEAIALREGGLEAHILVMCPVQRDCAAEVLEHDISLAVFDLDTARALAAEAARRGSAIRVHAKVDTGLGRLSVTPDHALPFIQALHSMEGLVLDGIYTHLADAEGIDQSMTLRQFVHYKRVLRQVEEQGIHVRYRHMAGSAAAMLMPELRYDVVRAGIALYGLWPSDETRLLMISRGQNLLNLLQDEDLQLRGVHSLLSSFLQPAMAFKTRVAQVKEVPVDWSVGYGCTYRTRRDTRIAVLPVGYADGYDRHLSNGGQVLIRGMRAPVVGRVSMNLTTVDVSDIAGVTTGDEVVLLGRQGTREITAEELAERIGTINYEVVTRIRWDLPRIYRTMPEPLAQASP